MSLCQGKIWPDLQGLCTCAVGNCTHVSDRHAYACRLLPHQNLPSQRVKVWRDLCECAEERLEGRLGFAACAGHHQVRLVPLKQ